jgi:RNA polymerase sigma factor (sigma-70 family)
MDIDQKTGRLIEEYLPLADLIAFEYSNIPGSQLNEARSEAHFALIRAAKAFAPERGEFVSLASRSIRNKLNTYYAKQLRLAKLFPESLDDPIRWNQNTNSSSSETHQNEREDPKSDLILEVRRSETSAALASVLKVLSPREHLMVEALATGSSLSQIAAAHGISKQATHKVMGGALNKLRRSLDRLGYRGLASDGHLAS